MQTPVACSTANFTAQSDGVQVILTCPQSLFTRFVELMRTREHDFKPFYSEFKKRSEVLEVMLKLSYLMEYCRATQKQFLYLSDASGVSQSVILDLESYIASPKFCFSDECTNTGSLVSCSLCMTCSWCSEECLAKSFEQHSQTLCEPGQKYRRELGLM